MMVSVLMSRAVAVRTIMILCLWAFSGPSVRADWNSTTTIESVDTRISVDVLSKGVKLSVRMSETGMQQLLENTADDSRLPPQLGEQERLNRYAAHIIKLEVQENILQATAKMVLPQEDIDSNSSTQSEKIYQAKVFYAFPESQPSRLLIAPDFELLKKPGDNFAIAVSHNGLPVIDHGVISADEYLLLNWDDPWYSHFENEALKRDHNDPVMAFLYVESNKLRSEVVVRVQELAHWMPLGIADDQMIKKGEFEGLKQRVGQFILQKNQVYADNALLKPTLERVGYIRMGAEDIQAYQPTSAQQPETTLIGVSLTYSLKDYPTSIKWHWGLFSSAIKSIAIRAYDPVGVFDSYVTSDFPVFEWENQLEEIGYPTLKAVPVERADSQFYDEYLGWLIAAIVLSILLFAVLIIYRKKNWLYVMLGMYVTAGIVFVSVPMLRNAVIRSSIEQQPAQVQDALFHQLLWNVYQAFEEKQESTVYDQLALSVSGDLLESLYMKNRRKLLVAGSAWSKINDIKMQSVIPETDYQGSGVSYSCEWVVIGEVVHWGHQHRRENLYRAKIQLQPIEGYWKIVGLQSLDQQDLDNAS